MLKEKKFPSSLQSFKTKNKINTPSISSCLSELGSKSAREDNYRLDTGAKSLKTL